MSFTITPTPPNPAAPLHVTSEGIVDRVQEARDKGYLVKRDTTATGPDQTLFLDLTRPLRITLPSDPIEGCRVTIHPVLGESSWTVESVKPIDTLNEAVPRTVTFTFEVEGVTSEGVWTVN